MRPALAAVSRMLGDEIKNDLVANQNQEPINLLRIGFKDNLIGLLEIEGVVSSICGIWF